MSILTVTSVVLILLGGFSRLGWPRALGLAGATPAGAALVVGDGIAVPTFAFVALAAVAVFGLRELSSARRTGAPAPKLPGLLALVLFFCWVVALTLTAPILFDGFAVTGPAVGEIHVLNSGAQPATSNIAQISYLALGIGSVVLVARDRRTGVSAVALMLITATVLSSWALVHRDLGVPFPEGVFDNSPSFKYISTAAGGIERFRGIFPEPAALAGVSLAALAFLVAAFPRTRGLMRAGLLVVIALTLWNISVSTATTALVSGIGILVIAGVVFGYRFVLRRQQVSSLLLVGLCGVGVLLLPALPSIADGVAATIDDKVGSSSYDDRSGADTFSYGLFARTFALGVGLGSNRPSSLLAGLLSTTGLVGTLLFLGAVACIVWSARRQLWVRPVTWAFVSFMLTRFISSPDLGDPTGLTWLCLGAMMSCAVRSDAAAAPLRTALAITSLQVLPDRSASAGGTGADVTLEGLPGRLGVRAPDHPRDVRTRSPESGA